MSVKTVVQPLSRYPELHEFFEGVDYFERKTICSARDLEQFIAGLLSYEPWWVHGLYRLRGVVAGILGLKGVAASTAATAIAPQDIPFTVGAEASFFTVKKARQGVYWLAETPEDKHLAAWLTILADTTPDGKRCCHVLTTLRYKHWTGPVYFNLIRVFHHLLVNAAMRAAAGGRGPGEREPRIIEYFIRRRMHMSQQEPRPCRLIDRFSLTERIIMRFAWLGFMAVAVYGIALQAPLWAAAYAAGSGLGFLFAVLPGLCAHCPYPSRHDTCLFMPPSLVRTFYPYRGPEMTAAGRVAALAALAAMVIAPLFWLIHTPLLLVIFLASSLPVLAAFPIYYCRRCRHHGCPLNRAEPCPEGTVHTDL